MIQTREGFRQFTKWADKQLNDAASWVNRRGRKLPADELTTVDAEPSSSLLGEWSGLAGAVTKYGVAVDGVPGGGELLGILHAVSGTEDAQARLLRSIDAKVDALVKGPYNTGRTHLREAQRLDVGDPQQRVHIEEAKTSFFQAHGQATSVQSRSLVEYHLGLRWLLLGRRDDVVLWFAQSHASAMTVANELANRADNVKVLHSPNTTAAAVTGDRRTATNELARLAAEHGHRPTTLDALVAVYLGTLEGRGRSRSTIRRYAQLWRSWLSPLLGTTRPDDLHRVDIEAALNAMHDSGQSQRSIHQAAVVLNTTLAWAREHHLTRANPVASCRLPNGTTLTATRHSPVREPRRSPHIDCYRIGRAISRPSGTGTSALSDSRWVLPSAR